MKSKIFLIFLLAQGLCYSQNSGSISGRVIDNETGYALEGATIIINQTNYSKSFIDDLLSNSSVTKFEQESTLLEEEKNIKKHFNKEKLEDIFRSLESDNSEWAKNTLKVLSKKSPTSMSVTIKQLSKAKNLSLRECLKMEFRICQAMMSKHDFYEGVRANLVEKDKNPNWDPRNILNVSDLLVEEHFKDLGEKELFIDE